MIIQNIVQIGDPLLTQKSKAVSDITSSKTKKTLQNLIDSMRHYNLVGMAASQIGEKKRYLLRKFAKQKPGIRKTGTS